MFTPLRIVSSYSFLKSNLTIEKIIKNLQKHKYVGAGISDSNVLYGVPEFINALEKNDKKYLVGLEILFKDNYLVSYALTEEGYRNLISLSYYANKGEISLNILKQFSSGIATILETNYGRFKDEFQKEKEQEFYSYYAKLSRLWSNFYLGLEVTNKGEFQYAQEIRNFAKERNYKCIAFPRIKYENKNDAITLEMLQAIEKGEKIEIKEKSGEQFFNNPEFYSKIYTKNEIDSTTNLLNKSEFKFHQKRGEIARYPVSDSVLTLKENVTKGLKDKGIYNSKHQARAEYELDVIIEMGYADYFLIVSDIVNFAKSKKIIVGPGRGSAAGSLVSYALNITEVDPLEYDLQFERFLNKARKSMPDIDIDIMDTRRDEVINYIRNKYGNNKVANIVTFQTIQAKQSLRDIGRICEIPTRHIDLLCKAIPDKLTLKEAYKKAPQFRSLIDSDKYFLEIVTLASKLEGLPRQAGMHPAGVILNETDIKSVLPVTIDLDDHYISQYEKDFLEDQGFLKMDILSLRNLTAVDYALKLIKENKGVELEFSKIPHQEKECFEIIRKCQTIGLFQLESKGMNNAIKIIQPTEFEDVVSLLALFRPGPMDNIKDFKNKKDNKDMIKYLSESLKEILAPTYGILVYQEQVNKIATTMAGFSKEDADLFRRAISHKNKEEILKNKSRFISDAIKNGYKEEDATSMFNRIEKFGDYGFNRSHAVAYAIIATRMAYLKVHYPLEFYTAVLSISAGSTDHKFSDYVSEIKSRGYQVKLPDINKSGKHYEVIDNSLIIPLSNIKGLTDNAIEKILDERKLNGEYKDFYDFVSRSYHTGVSDVMIIKLIDAGALDSLYNSRASMRNTLRYALQLAELSYDKNGQLILDATLENQKQFFTDIDDPLENLNLEYEALGINLSDNPLKYKHDLLEKNNVIKSIDVSSSYGKVNVAGIISNVKTIKVKKNGSTMAFIRMFDEYGDIEITVFAKVYEKVFNLLNKNQIILVSGRYDHSRDDNSFVADEIKLLEE